MFDNHALKDKVFGKRAWFGEEGIEYVAFIGLRGDEQLRVARVEDRASSPHANTGYEGDHVYMPLATMHVSKEDVLNFGVTKRGIWHFRRMDLCLTVSIVS